MTRPTHSKITTSGFTLLESLIVVVILGILSAISVLSWRGIMDRQILNMSQDTIYRALQTAKSNAVKDKIYWQLSLRQQNGITQWQLSPASSGPAPSQWQSFSPKVAINPNKTTLYYSDQEGIWKIEFDHYGVPNGQIGKVTLGLVKNPKLERCVVVAMLIGAIRKDSNKGCDKY